MKTYRLIFFIVLIFFIFSIQTCFAECSIVQTPIIKAQIINVFPHDPEAFTQGLAWKNGFLYEGTGLYGNSSLRKIDLKSGEILKRHNLPDTYFGEGITIFQDKIYQLTWQEQTGFIYDLETFKLLDTFYYSHEGWGITNDGKNLIISDGTPVLYFIDPFTLEETKQIKVYERQTTVNRINELEYIQGKIYANIWQTDRIAIIEPESGEITAWLDLSGILDPADVKQEIDVLNGIGYDSENDRLFVTGKLWPKIFQIKMVETTN